jgi:hypothetical protein
MFEHIYYNGDGVNDKLEHFLRVNVTSLQHIKKNIEFPIQLIQKACDHIEKAIDLLLEASGSSELLKEFLLIVEKKKARYRRRIEVEFDELEESMYYEGEEIVIVKENALKAIERIREILKEN